MSDTLKNVEQKDNTQDPLAAADNEEKTTKEHQADYESDIIIFESDETPAEKKEEKVEEPVEKEEKPRRRFPWQRR